MENKISGVETRPKTSTEKFPELSSLIRPESVDYSMTFRLENEPGVITEKGDSAFWMTLKDSRGRKVEGKFFISGENQEKLLIFQPGMPGDSNKWMEERFIETLIRSGYSVFCIRHNGTKINVENADAYINCPERIKLEESAKGAVTGKIDGKSEYNLDDISNEPEIAVEALQEKFRQLYLMGHSSGVADILVSLSKLPKEIKDKVRNLISLAGYIGHYDNSSDTFDEKFTGQGMEVYYEYCKKFIAMGDPKKNVELKKTILKSLSELDISDNTNLILVNSTKDEYVTTKSAENFRDYIGRGLMIIDETQKEPEYHDLKNLRPETLLRLMNIYHPGSNHTVTFNKS